ncbi:MAG: hypothetical protein WC145_09185 [Aliarcobacter sp.]|jgi:hypothetical protein
MKREDRQPKYYKVVVVVAHQGKRTRLHKEWYIATKLTAAEIYRNKNHQIRGINSVVSVEEVALEDYVAAGKGGKHCFELR